MTQINGIHEARLAFEDWCKWNARKLSGRDFVAQYGMSPTAFRLTYWKKGLQKYWIKWATKK